MGPPPASAAACTPILTIMPSSPTVANGSNTTFTLALANTGTGTCSSVYFSLYYPSELSFVSANPSATSGGYYWSFPSLTAGQTRAISLITKAQTAQALPWVTSLEGCLNAGGMDACTSSSITIAASGPSPTPTPTSTPTPSITPTPTPSAPATPSPSPSPSPSSSPQPTPTPTATPVACTNLAPNLLPNSGFESANGTTPQSWMAYKDGTNTTIFTHLTSGGWNDSRAIQVQTTKYTNGDAYWGHTNVPVTGGKLYEYRDKYMTTFQGEIDAVYTMADGSIQYQYVGTATESSDWNEFYALLRAPVGAIAVNVFHSIYGVGTLTVDEVSLRAYQPSGFNRGIVTLTFDDHPPLTYGLPVFDKYAIKTTHYIQTEPDTLVGYPDITSPQTVRALRDAGHEVGGHTISHPHLPQIPTSQVISELADSQATLRSWLGEPNGVRHFASPFGETSVAIRNTIAQYYDSHRSVDAGYNDKCNFDRYDLKVQNMFYTTTLAQVQEWVDQAYTDHTWLVLVYHAISPNSALAPYTTNPTDLDAQIAYMKTKGITIKTVTDALAELSPQLPGAPTPTPTATPSPSPTPSPTSPPSPTPAWSPAPNLIPNPSFETVSGALPTSWSKKKSGNNKATFTYLPSGQSGNRSVKVQVTSYRSGDAYWAHPQKPVTAGRIYELSGYYQSDVYTNVIADFTLANATHTYTSLYVPPASPTDWNFFYAQFVPPTNAVSVSISQALEQKGFVQTDNLLLREYRPLGFVRGVATITIDADIVKYGMPIIDQYGFKTTQLMTTGFIDANDTRPDYINPPTLRRLLSEGHEIAAHSVSHPFLPQLSIAAAQQEIEQSKLILEGWLHSAVEHFAAPFGEVTPQVLSFIKSKFASHRGTDPGYNSRDNFDAYNIKVHYVHSDTTATQMRAWADDAKAKKLWLVLLYHDVNPDVNFEVDTTTPTNLDAQLKALQDSGLPVKTVTAALSELQPQL